MRSESEQESKGLTAKAPFVWTTLFLIGGIAWGLQWPVFDLRILLGLAVVSLGIFYVLFRGEKVWSTALLVFTCGLALTSSRIAQLNSGGPGNLGRDVRSWPQSMMLRGFITSDPISKNVEARGRAQAGKIPRTQLQTDFELQVSAVNLSGEWKQTSGSVSVRKVQPLSSKDQMMEPVFLEYGDEIDIEGTLEEPPVSRNFGLFDYKDYLRQQGIAFVFRSEGSDSMVLRESSSANWVFKLRKYLAQRLALGIENDELAVGIINGMLLGYREDIPNDVNESFRRTGTLHVFAISGSHISLIAFILLVLLKQARVSQRWSAVIVVPLIILYVFMTGLRSSSIRSVAMAAVIIMGWFLERPSSILNNLAFAAFLILVWNPLQLIDAGFQLSFLVVLSLVLLVPMLDGVIRTWFQPDPWIPKSHVPRYWRWISPIGNAFSSLLSVSVCAWIGTLGLTLYYFHLFSVTSILANLIIVPLASASVGVGAMSLVFGLFWDQLGMTLNFTHAAIIHLMLGITDYLSKAGGFIYVPEISSLVVVSIYIVIAVLTFFLFTRRPALFLSGVVAVILSCAVLIYTRWSSSTLRIDVLDVGDGQSILLSGPHFERILLDAGSRASGVQVVKPFLRSRGVNGIDVAIISHADPSHYGGFQSILGDIPVKRIILADANFRSKAYDAFLRELAQYDVIISKWNQTSEEEFLSGHLRGVWPLPNAEAPRADDFGLVLELQHGKTRTLFLSDSGIAVEEMISDMVRPPYDFLIQGNNGHERLMDDGFLTGLSVSNLILTSSSMPSDRLVQSLSSKVSRAWFTAERGGMYFEVTAKGAKLFPRFMAAGHQSDNHSN